MGGENVRYFLGQPDSGRCPELSGTCCCSAGGRVLSAGGPGLGSTAAATVVLLVDVAWSVPLAGGVVMAVAAVVVAAVLFLSCDSAASLSVQELVPSAFLRPSQIRARPLA